MTQDQQLEAAFARLTAALASLEAAAGHIRDRRPPQDSAVLDPGGALERAAAKAERLEAASEAAAHILHGAIEALTAILSRPGSPTED
jgi:hypothetical protein